jgi:thiamine kinase-like enzyme
MCLSTVWVKGKNLTLLHGDAHLWNLYYPKDPETDRIILFDWETIKRGLGAYDLAYLLIHGTSVRYVLQAYEDWDCGELLA